MHQKEKREKREKKKRTDHMQTMDEMTPALSISFKVMDGNNSPL